MPAKQLRFDTEARQLLRRGVDAVADAVAVNAETSSRRGFTPFSQFLPDASMSPSRFWNFRTQAEQTWSESGSRDSVEKSMCDPLTAPCLISNTRISFERIT